MLMDNYINSHTHWWKKINDKYVTKYKIFIRNIEFLQ